jgi:octanoyl-[GcvH]:protein N-octanoyltransferase
MLSLPQAALIRGMTTGDAAAEIALSTVLLDAVAHGARPVTVRFYRPPPTVAFGRQEMFLPGFPAAAAAARAHRFAPVLRAPGGRAAAYDPGSLVIDEIAPDRDSIRGIQDRFATRAASHAATLRGLGVDARIGQVAGEYCPGDYTINAGGRLKLIGTAQRVVRGAWLLSAVVVIEGSARLRPVLRDVYAALGLDWDPDTVGAVAELAPTVGIDVVERALLESYRDRYELVPGTVRPQLIDSAWRAAEQSRIEAAQ